jgi:glycosyltransferase involved in cell wall biosynthesis
MYTLGIPTFNRWSMVADSCRDVIGDDRITEVLIVDDASEEASYEKLLIEVQKLNSDKIKIIRNEKNKKAFFNKLTVIEEAKNDWVILLDSDNKITPDYLNSIPKELDVNTFYLPSMTHGSWSSFNFTKHNNAVFDKLQYKQLMTQNLSHEDACMLNAGNFLVNKNTYKQSIDLETSLLDPYGIDPFYQIFLGFKNINDFKIMVVEGMHYYHRMHNSFDQGEMGSWWVQNSQKSLEFLETLKSMANNI